MNTPYYVSFDTTNGRLGNQLFRYLICKLFTIRFGNKYICSDDFPKDNILIVTEQNIESILVNNQNATKHIYCKGYFQNSDLFVNERKELQKYICHYDNNDYFKMHNEFFYVKDYLNEKNVIDTKDNIVLHLRLDDFIQYPCKTSDILPPQYYIDILSNMNTVNKTLYIVCDKLRYHWEFKYLEFFKKWNYVLIQGSLKQYIAALRDSKILIHSNSSLCWIISFLYDKQRFIPYTCKKYMYQNQSLKKIDINDRLINVFQLYHDEVHQLDVNDTQVLPLSFCVPDECVVDDIPEKEFLLASLIPGKMSTYIFDKYKEKEYNEMYRKSRFAITKMKGGWDCLRHYEILMNGCIPLFENLKDCPNYTLTTYPKELNDQAYDLYNNWSDNDNNIAKYNILCKQYLDHTKKKCTTSYTAKYLLDNIKNGDKIKNVLLITCHSGVNYNRETLWIGIKRHIESIGGIAVEYNKIPFLYDDFDNLSKNKYYDNNCFTFPKRLKKDKYYDMDEDEIKNKINDQFWDLIIYGKVGPDEFCNFPFYNIVKSNYNKNKIVFIFGGDEIFNLKITDPNSYHINMFNNHINYVKYNDYLNYFKQFGTCFVRELDK